MSGLLETSTVFLEILGVVELQRDEGVAERNLWWRNCFRSGKIAQGFKRIREQFEKDTEDLQEIVN